MGHHSESLGNLGHLFTVLRTLQDGGCSCPGDVAKAFGKAVGEGMGGGSCRRG